MPEDAFEQLQQEVRDLRAAYNRDVPRWPRGAV